MTKVPIKQTIYESVHRFNILPLTSRCNVNCLFCSHRQNPAGIESLTLPPLSSADMEDLFLFLSPDRKIVIGESATRIMEGEPFTHPECLAIMRSLRKKFPDTPLQITTNGTLLSRETVKALKELEPLEINLSLNSAASGGRRMLMGDKEPDRAILAAQILQENGICYHGSLVPLPWLTGWEDPAAAVAYLDKNGASTIRVFLPGFTEYTRAQLKPPQGWEEELRKFVTAMRSQVKAPLTLEPPEITELEPVIAGVMANTPASRAGLREGESILEIDGAVPFSRVDAYRRLQRPGAHSVKVKEAAGEKISEIENIWERRICIGRGERSGLVFDYDLDPETAQMIVRAGRDEERVLVLSSAWGAPLIEAGLKKLLSSQNGLAKFTVRPVVNHTFGGNIRCAGLLLVDDFQAALQDFRAQGGQAGLVLIPALAFDERGRDLRGTSWREMEDIKIKKM